METNEAWQSLGTAQFCRDAKAQPALRTRQQARWPHSAVVRSLRLDCRQSLLDFIRTKERRQQCGSAHTLPWPCDALPSGAHCRATPRWAGFVPAHRIAESYCKLPPTTSSLPRSMNIEGEGRSGFISTKPRRLADRTGAATRLFLWWSQYAGARGLALVVSVVSAIAMRLASFRVSSFGCRETVARLS